MSLPSPHAESNTCLVPCVSRMPGRQDPDARAPPKRSFREARAREAGGCRWVAARGLGHGRGEWPHLRVPSYHKAPVPPGGVSGGAAAISPERAAPLLTPSRNSQCFPETHSTPSASPTPTPLSPPADHTPQATRTLRTRIPAPRPWCHRALSSDLVVPPVIAGCPGSSLTLPNEDPCVPAVLSFPARELPSGQRHGSVLCTVYCVPRPGGRRALQRFVNVD